MRERLQTERFVLDFRDNKSRTLGKEKFGGRLFFVHQFPFFNQYTHSQIQILLFILHPRPFGTPSQPTRTLLPFHPLSRLPLLYCQLSREKVGVCRF